jgi:hypothetical protein
MNSMITVTTEEINYFRSGLVGHSAALAALDTIEECGGYVEDAVQLLLMRETANEPERGVNNLLDKCRKFACQEEVREALKSGILAPAIEPIAIGVGIPPGTATALSICIFKLGMNKFCDEPELKP